MRDVEILCALSVASDFGTGQPAGHALETCAVAVALAAEAGIEGEDLREVYCVALLHSLGCTADAWEAAQAYGDDIAVRAAYSTVDPSRPREILGFLAHNAGAGRPPVRRAAMFLRAAATGPKGARAGFTSHCEVARRLAARLDLAPGTQHALGYVYERWDGKGQPTGVGGDSIPRSARVLHVARDLVLLSRQSGRQAALQTLVERSGSAYDPDLAAAASRCSGALATASWDEVLALDPVPARGLAADDLDRALVAVADFADLKSPCMLGHSRQVAALAEAACWRLGLTPDQARDVRHAALLADLGRVGVSNAIWDKPGRLTDAEWEQVRLHPYITERALSRSPGLARLAELAGAHHERLGGHGYHRGIDAGTLPIGARVLAAADAYATFTQARPHRPALAPAAAAARLRDTPLDPSAVEALLSLAGHPAQAVRRERPAGLSEREVQVLALVARGHTIRTTASALGISAKTVDHHVQHVYTKIGVTTRAAAALYAVENRLLDE